MSYVGNTPTQQAFTPAIQYFSGNGSTTAFTLSRPVASVAQVQAVIENVPQNPGSAFTVSGNTITFTSAPPTGTNNIYVYYTSPITQVIQPGQGTVAPSSLSTGGPSWDTSGNVTLTGNITLNNGAADGAQLTLNSAGYSAWNWDNYSGRLRAYYNATEYFTIDTSGNVGIGTSSPNPLSGVFTPYLTVKGASYDGVMQVLGSRGDGANTGVGQFNFLQDGNTTYKTVAQITSETEGTTANNRGGRLMFFTKADGATSTTERARIDSSGNLLVGTTTPVTNERLNVTSGQGSGVLVLNRTDNIDSNLRDMVLFRRSSTGVGSISCSNTATSYNTSSDYRLKENIAPMTGALSVVQALKPCTYNWKVDGSNGQGFIAHELQEVVPDCVTGEKDAVETYIDEEGNEQTRPVYQGIDTSFLVATLTAAIQEQQALIQSLTARIEALEGK